MKLNYGASQQFTKMYINVLKGKLQEVTVTEANKDYEGSITICRDLMGRAGIAPYQQVYINGKNHPSRIMTYVIPGEKGEIKLNGGASLFFKKGDKIHVLAFVLIEPQFGWSPLPMIIHTDENNKAV